MDAASSEGIRPTSLSISSLLNNPNSNLTQTSGGRPSNRDIPLVHLSSVPTASRADFSSYLAVVGPEYDNFISAKQYGLQQHLRANQMQKRPSGSIFSGTEGLEARVADFVPSSVAESSRMSFDETASIFSMGQGASPNSEVDGFSFGELLKHSQVPTIFAEEEFELKNPRTFDLVTGNINIVAPLFGKVDGKANQESSSHLQEKLSNFLDLVETSLVDEISATGPAVFHALEDLRDLQSRANNCITRIDSLREEFARLSAENADLRIDSAKQTQKRDNTRRLRRGLKRIQRIRLAYDKIVKTEAIEDTRATMTAMTALQGILDENPGFANLQLVEEIQYNVDKIKYSLGQADIARFKKILMQDLALAVNECDVLSFFESLRHRHVRVRRASQGPINLPAKSNSELLRIELEATLDSLSYTDQVHNAFLEYKESIIREVKAITKRQLPAGDDEDIRSNISGKTNRTTADKSTALAKNLRSMSANEFNVMLREIYMQTCAFVRQLSVHQKVLIDLISSSAGSFSQSTQDAIYSSHLALTAVDVCQARIVKLLNVRTSVSSDLTGPEVVLFYELNATFNRECEALTGQLGNAIQNVTNSHVNAFFHRFSEDLGQAVVAMIELDTWQPTSLSNIIQGSVDAFLDAAVKNPVQWQEPVRSTRITTEVLSGPLKSITIHKSKFIVPLSAAALLLALEQLLSVSQLLPPVRNECANSTIDVLRMFNSRSCQLILGAGATKSAGLERITAKHLAVTSQALSIIIILVPCLKAHLQRQCGASLMSAEFDKTVQLYNEHRAEIHSKLISIMEDRTAQICRQLSEWLSGAAASMGEPESVSNYMTALVKDTLVLARVLTKFLEPDALESILKSVIDLEETRLVDEYRNAPIDAGVQTQIDLDKAHFVEKISGIRKDAGWILNAKGSA